MRINYAIDWALTHLMLLCLAFLCVRFYVRNLVLALFIAIITLAVVSVIAHFALKGRRTRLHLSREKGKKLDFCMQQLMYSSPSDNLTYFHNLLCGKYKVDIVGGFLLLNDSVLVMIKYSPSRVSVSDMCAAFHKGKDLAIAKIAVLARAIDKDVYPLLSLFSHFSVRIYNEAHVFNLIEKQGIYPPTVVQPKPKTRILLPVIFSPDKTKGYLGAALTLMLGSIFLPYSVYYSISGAVLIVAAIICHKKVFAPPTSPSDL